MTGVWKKGTMQFIIKHDWDNKEERMVSKKDEPPSEFIKRILNKCKGFNGDAVWNYLLDDMKVVE